MSGARFCPSVMFDGTWLRIPDWLLVRTDLDLSDKVIYGVLARHARGNTYCWPFIKTLAQQTGLSDKTVERSTRRLEEVGLIEIERPDDRKDWTRAQLESVKTSGNRYFFVRHEWIPAEFFAEPEEPTDTESDGQQTRSPLGNRHGVSRGTDTVSPPYMNRSSEQTQEKTKRTSVGPTDRHETIEARPPKGSAPHDVNDQINNAATVEVATALSSEELVTRGIEHARRARAEAALQGAKDKSEEARNRKRANSYRPKRVAFDELPPDEPEKTPLSALSHVWRRELSEVFPEVPVPKRWGMDEYGKTKELLKRYDRDQVELVFVYVIRNWLALRQRMFKGTGSPVPGVGFVLKLHGTLMPEAVLWSKHREVIDEYRNFGDADDERPYDLQERYSQAMTELKALNLDDVGNP